MACVQYEHCSDLARLENPAQIMREWRREVCAWYLDITLGLQEALCLSCPHQKAPAPAAAKGLFTTLYS